MAAIPEPDVEALLIAFLLGNAEVAAIAGEHIDAELREAKEDPFLRVMRVGGTKPFHDPDWLWAPRVQLDAWADDREIAHDLAVLAKAVLIQESPGAHPLGVVTSVRETLSLRPLPDPDTGRPRFLSEIEVRLHPPN